MGSKNPVSEVPCWHQLYKIVKYNCTRSGIPETGL